MKKKFNQCYDISQKNVDYLAISKKRSFGSCHTWKWQGLLEYNY